MAATIIGSPSATATATNGKVLRRQQYQKEINGLETIVETYTIQTQNLLSIIPDKDTKHTAFSTATSKYARMAVESIATSEMDGGLTELNVTFVGLTASSGLPPAIVRVIPNTGSGIFGPPVVIEAEFVTDLTEFQVLQGQFSSFSTAEPSSTIKIYRMPSFINGTAMPPNPRPPFNQSGTGLFSGFLYRYEGYVMQNVQTTRRGQFNVAVISFNEYAVSISGTSGGFSTGIFTEKPAGPWGKPA
jgi:hypothetical protein